MCNKHAFVANIMTRLDRLYSGLNQLEASAQLARAEAQDAYQARMADLRQKCGAAEIHRTAGCRGTTDTRSLPCAANGGAWRALSVRHSTDHPATDVSDNGP